MENQHLRSLLLKSSKLILLTFFVVILLIGGVIPLWSIPSSIPNVDSLMSKKILDRNGLVIQLPLNVREERGDRISLDEIPSWISDSFIVSEDKRFFSHYGVDFLAISRAVFQSIKNLRIVSGASTITMQLVRIYWPNLSRPQLKLAQVIQAIRIELNYSKAEILNHYFNVVPFAHQTIGIKQACLYFFNKSCSRLSFSEGAILAILPRNPNLYLKDFTKLKHSKNKLLFKLFEKHKIDKLSYEQAISEPILFNNGFVKSTAYHFVNKLFNENIKHFKPNSNTTLDLNLQKSIQSILSEHIQKHKDLGDAGAILIVENNTGNVLVYIGSPGYFNRDHGMLDAIQTLRSPGSALKPFVYALALEKGWTLSSLVPDIPIKFKVEKGVYSPNNYGGSFSGPIQLRFALANSKNIPALFLTSKLGEGAVLSYLNKIGFESLTKSSEHYGVGIALGNGEVSLWELVQAYSALANGGVKKKLKLIPNDYNYNDDKRIMPENISNLITDVLSDPMARADEFGRGGNLEFDYNVAAKTGTSSDFRDHWTIGYTSRYTVGIWKGNANGKPLGKKVPASRGAGILFKLVMNKINSNLDYISNVGKKSLIEKRVCSLSGELATSNCESTRLESFNPKHIPHRGCSFHKEIFVKNCNNMNKVLKYVELPREYSSWAEASYVPTLDKVLKEKCGWNENRILSYQSKNLRPEIVEPVSGATLAIDPTIPHSHQKLRIQFSDQIENKSARLLINGQFYKWIEGQSFIDWPIEKGQFSFQIFIDNQHLSNHVEINVL